MKERLQQLIDYYGLKTAQFEQRISVSNGAIRNAMRRDGGLNSEILGKILDVYPDVNPDWLLLGKGEMLRPSNQAVGNITHSTAVGVNVNGNDINISYDPLLLPTVESLSDSVSRLTAQNAQLLSELSRLISIIEKKIA